MTSIKNYFFLFLFFISCHNNERKYNTLYLSTSNGDMYSINLKKEKLNWKIWSYEFKNGIEMNQTAIDQKS